MLTHFHSLLVLEHTNLQSIWNQFEICLQSIWDIGGDVQLYYEYTSWTMYVQDGYGFRKEEVIIKGREIF